MPRQDYWPKRWADLVAWFQNFHAQLVTHQLTLGITAGQLAQVLADRDMIIAVNDACNNSDAYGKECTAYREIIVNAPMGTPLPAPPTLPSALVPPAGAAPAMQARTRALVNQIKANANYSDAIGQSLGIIGSEQTTQDVKIRSAQALGASQVELWLLMAGYATIAVFSKRGGGGWEQIGISTQTTFVDTRGPLSPGDPETREYRVQAYVNNQLTGPISDIVSVVTIP